MVRRPPRSTRTDPLLPYPTLFRSWISHFYDICVAIQPVQKITDERWVWHIGLDAEGNALLNDLYNGIEVGEGRLAQLLSLFRMDFRRSEERSVGKEGVRTFRSRWSPYNEKKTANER